MTKYNPKNYSAFSFPMYLTAESLTSCINELWLHTTHIGVSECKNNLTATYFY